MSEFLQEQDKLWTRSSNSSQIPLCTAGMISLDGQLDRSTAAFNISDTLTHFINVSLLNHIGSKRNCILAENHQETHLWVLLDRFA